MTKVVTYGDLSMALDIKPVRGRWIYDRELKKMVPIDEYRKPPTESVTIMTDEIEPWTSHAEWDGPTFTSRAKRDAYLKEKGFIINEPGVIPTKQVLPPKRDFREVREDVERTYYDIKYDRIPFNEKEKALWKKEQEMLKRR